jgi:glycosyltransferase involved in cell wall biosynthesis
MKIVVFTQSPVSKAPRVVKEANCLVHYGFNVTVFSLWHEEKVLEADFSLLSRKITYKAGANLLHRNLKTNILRLERRFYREIVRFFGFQSKRSLGYGYSNYLSKLKAENADLYIGHQEMSMALSKELMESGFKVAFDFEDYHSHDLLPKDMKYRPLQLLKFLQGYLLNNAQYCTTTSDALAQELAKEYRSKIPMTIYNSFHRFNANRGKKENNNINSLVWISQVIGPGRGLELFIKGVKMSKMTFELTLIGKKEEKYSKEIQKLAPNNLVIHFIDFIPSNQIHQELKKFDLGVAFEEFFPLSRNLTITNKIFHYLTSGIAILATNTKGQIELSIKADNAVAIVQTNPEAIAAVLDRVFSDTNQLERMKEKSKYYGESVFCFENEETKIIGLVNSIEGRK